MFKGYGGKRTSVDLSGYGWYNLIYHLSGGDVTKIDKVTKEPATKVLFFLSYETDKAKRDEELRRNGNT